MRTAINTASGEADEGNHPSSSILKGGGTTIGLHRAVGEVDVDSNVVRELTDLQAAPFYATRARDTTRV